MKIALVTSSPPGYSETFLDSKIKGLIQAGYEVILITGSTAKRYKNCKHIINNKQFNSYILKLIYIIYTWFSLLPHIHHIKRFYQIEKSHKKPLTSILKDIYLNAELLKLKVDWLHFGFTTMALERETLAKAIKAKMAVSFRGYDINVYPKKHPGCYQKVWKYVDKVHSISHYLIQEAQRIGLPQNIPTHIITPAVDLEKLTDAPIAAASSQKLQLLTIARLTWIKGLDFLIETAAYLKKQGVDFEWLVVGDGKKEEKERYLYHVYEKKLTSHVRFFGKKSHQETLELLREADIYVQTSYNEGFCNAVLEAQALGKLCLAFDTGGLSENINHEQTGWLVKPFDEQKLAEKIMEVSQLSEEEKSKITSRAMSRVKEEFNIERQQRAFVNFYQLPL